MSFQKNDLKNSMLHRLSGSKYTIHSNNKKNGF